MLRSLYYIKISGRDIKRFIKKLYRSEIYFESIEIYDKYAYICITKDNYEKLIKLKTIYKIEIIKLYGLVRIIDTIKRYKVFIICLLIGYIYLLILSNIIMDVEVIHSKKNIRNVVYKELEQYNIKKYSFIKSYNKKELIENKILENNKDLIEWIEIERVGCKYIVKLEERIIKRPSGKKNNQNIIAKKDGIIKKIEAIHGEVIKKKDDYVKKGDVIISGIITKNDKIKNVIAAEGKCYAEVWYKTSIDMPLYYKEIKYTNNYRNVLKIKFLNKDIYLLKLKKFKTYKEEEILSLKNNILPIRFSLSKEEETIVKEEVYTKDSAVNKAEKLSLEKINKTIKKDEKVLKSKILSINEYENYVHIEIFYKVYEDITDYKSISKEDILNQSTNKES